MSEKQMCRLVHQFKSLLVVMTYAWGNVFEGGICDIRRIICGLEKVNGIFLQMDCAHVEWWL